MSRGQSQCVIRGGYQWLSLNKPFSGVSCHKGLHPLILSEKNKNKSSITLISDELRKGLKQNWEVLPSHPATVSAVQGWGPGRQKTQT